VVDVIDYLHWSVSAGPEFGRIKGRYLRMPILAHYATGVDSPVQLGPNMAAHLPTRLSNFIWHLRASYLNKVKTVSRLAQC
jgi:hypothetical protein